MDFANITELPIELELLIGITVECFASDIEGVYEVQSDSTPKWIIKQRADAVYRSLEVYPALGLQCDSLLFISAIMNESSTKKESALVSALSKGVVTIPISLIAPPFNTYAKIHDTKYQLYNALRQAWGSMSVFTPDHLKKIPYGISTTHVPYISALAFDQLATWLMTGKFQ